MFIALTASVGGGRTRLPRSIRNLFTIVRLDEPRPDEIASITIDLFGGLLEQRLVDHEHVTKLLQFHQAVLQAVLRRDLGRGTINAHFGLRDIIKVGTEDSDH